MPRAVSCCLRDVFYLSAVDLPRQNFIRTLRLSRARVAARGPRIRRQSRNPGQISGVLVWRSDTHDSTCQCFLSLAGIAIPAPERKVRHGEVPTGVVYDSSKFFRHLTLGTTYSNAVDCGTSVTDRQAP